MLYSRQHRSVLFCRALQLTYRPHCVVHNSCYEPQVMLKKCTSTSLPQHQCSTSMPQLFVLFCTKTELSVLIT